MGGAGGVVLDYRGDGADQFVAGHCGERLGFDHVAIDGNAHQTGDGECRVLGVGLVCRVAEDLILHPGTEGVAENSWSGSNSPTTGVMQHENQVM